jgi:predicted DCC family thiol-disulfide oxidoreductase YuxK
MTDIIYDGDCGFCRRALRLFARVDVWHRLRLHDARRRDDLLAAFPGLAGADLDDAMYVVTRERRVYRGFFAFRRLIWNSPFTWPLVALFYFPGAATVGPRVYAQVARNRRRLGCDSDGCAPPPDRSADQGDGSSRWAG